MPEKLWFVVSPVLLTVVFYGSSSSLGFVEREFFLTWYMCTFSMERLIVFFTSFKVSPGRDWKYYFLIARIHISDSWRYLTKSV